MDTITGRVIETKLVGHSNEWNPIIEVTLSTSTPGYPSTYTVRTRANTHLAFLIESEEYKNVPHVFSIGQNRLSRDLGRAE